MVFSNKFLNFFKHQKLCKETIKVYKEIPNDGLPIVGSLFSLIASGSSPKLHLYIDAKHKRMGPIFREVLPLRNTLFLSDPDKIRQVFSIEGKHPSHFLPESWIKYNDMYKCKRGLLFMEDDEWSYYRKMMNQYLIRDDISSQLINVYQEILNLLINKWRNYEGKCLKNLENDMYVHSISFMMATAMGSSYNRYYSNFNADLEKLSNDYQQIFDATSKLMVVPVGFVSYLNLPIWKNFVDAMNNSLSGSEAIISKMMKYTANDGLIKKILDAGVDRKMINIILTDLMIAAGDTTAFTMQWILYLLGKDKSIQQQMLIDSDSVKGVIKEALRLYPAAPFLTRIIQQPMEVLDYRIPAGELIVMSMYTCGRTQSNFPNPDKFQPDRWNRNEDGQLKGVTNKYASLPFSMGARSCVGKKLAENLMISTINKIITNFELTTLKDVDMILRMIPAPTERIQLRIDKRKKQHNK